MSDDKPVWVGSEPVQDVAERAADPNSMPSRADAETVGPDTPLVVDLDWRSAAIVMVLIVVMALAVTAIRHASIGVTLIVVSLFLALALDPLVDRVQRVPLGRHRNVSADVPPYGPAGGPTGAPIDSPVDDPEGRPADGSDATTSDVTAERSDATISDVTADGAFDQRRHLGRGVSVLIVVLAVAAAFGAFVALAGPQLVSQSRALPQQLPHTVDSLRHIPILGPHLVDWDVPDRVTEFLSSLPAKISEHDADLGGVAKGVGFGVGAFVLGAVLAVGALIDGPRLVRTVRAAVPVAQRPRADDIGRIVYSVIGRYFAGSLLIALLNGIWVSMWAIVSGAPLGPVLGVWAALTSLIPQIGGLMGFAVVVVVSLAGGLVPAVVMTVAFLFFMLLTNHVLQPTIVGRAVELSAPVTMLAAIAGFTVGGVVGALFAVPTVGAIKAVLTYMRDPDHVVPARPEHHSRFSVGRLRAWLARRRHQGDPAPTT